MSLSPPVRSLLNRLEPLITPSPSAESLFVTEGWLEIDEHYSLELCFSIEKQPVPEHDT